jgi:3'-5' exoribonuclease
MARLPRITELAADSVGWGFYLCARKEVRTGRSGEYLSLMLQDASGEIRAKVFQEVELSKREFDAGEFVKIQGRGNSFNQQVELVLDKIRRVMPERDASDGFREEDCIRCAPRPAAEMWAELMAHVDGLTDLDLRELLRAMLAEHGDRMKIWPAARQVHHAYRSGLLEHVLQLIGVASFLADRYGARRDLVIAGAILHDIGKLQELTYDLATGYSVEGNLLGHIALGLGMVRDAIRERPAFPPALALELEHLILSHHGSRELGSPVEPMTIEAFILAATDDLDAKIQQIRQHLADDDSDGPFTSYHRRLERVFLKPSQSPTVQKS